MTAGGTGVKRNITDLRGGKKIIDDEWEGRVLVHSVHLMSRIKGEGSNKGAVSSGRFP